MAIVIVIEEEDIGNIWFYQDGATCHTTEATLDVQRFVFENRIISCRADVIQPPRSCNLTLSDYYLQGAVKAKCYADKPETIDALKLNRSCRLLPGMNLFYIIKRKDGTFK